ELAQHLAEADPGIDAAFDHAVQLAKVRHGGILDAAGAVGAIAEDRAKVDAEARALGLRNQIESEARRTGAEFHSADPAHRPACGLELEVVRAFVAGSQHATDADDQKVAVENAVFQNFLSGRAFGYIWPALLSESGDGE